MLNYCRDQCLAPFSYFVRQKGYFPPVPPKIQFLLTNKVNTEDNNYQKAWFSGDLLSTHLDRVPFFHL